MALPHLITRLDQLQEGKVIRLCRAGGDEHVIGRAPPRQPRLFQHMVTQFGQAEEGALVPVEAQLRIEIGQKIPQFRAFGQGKPDECLWFGLGRVEQVLKQGVNFDFHGVTGED